jgi:hypothetical protein
MKFLPISLKKKSPVGNFSPKTEGKNTKAARWLFSDVFSLPVQFEFFAIFFYCLHFAKFVCLSETAKIETGMAEKSSWDQANIEKNTRFSLEK